MEKPKLRAGVLAVAGAPAIILPNWREMLNRCPLSGPTRAGYALAIAWCLDYCRQQRVEREVG